MHINKIQTLNNAADALFIAGIILMLICEPVRLIYLLHEETGVKKYFSAQAGNGQNHGLKGRGIDMPVMGPSRDERLQQHF
jgi:hypothetical protein